MTNTKQSGRQWRNVLVALEEFVLVLSLDRCLHRIDALRLFLEAFQNHSETPDSQKRWIRRVSKSDLPVVRLENGALQLASTQSSKTVLETLPRDLIGEVLDALTAIDGSEDDLLVEIEQTLWRWEQLAIDMEKLFGHLILEHGEQGLQGKANLKQTSLHKAHTSLHKQTRRTQARKN